MAKTLSKSAGLRARQSLPAKSTAKAAPAKAPAKAAAVKSPAAKSPPAKAGRVRLPEPKTPARKAAPAKAPAAKAKKEADKSPASEAEIIGAVTGKLATRGAAKGFGWLGSKAEPASVAVSTPAPVEPVVEEKVAAPPVVEAPAPAIIEPTAEIIPVVEPLPEIPAVEEAPPATPETPAIATEAETAAPVAEAPPAAVEPAVEEIAPVVPAEPVAAIPVADPSPAPALGAAVKAAATQLGWTLALQGVVFAAFCTLVKGGAPLSGLPWFLTGVIPLFAMILIVAAFLTFAATQRMLDRLEGGNSPLTALRRQAHLPAQIILGTLLLAWFCIGITVWWL